MRHKAIYATHPTVIYISGDIDAQDESGSSVELDEGKIATEVARLQAQYDTQEYARNRALEYPSNGDQWDMIYKDNLNSTTTHKDAVEAVKTKWPKNNTGPVE